MRKAALLYNARSGGRRSQRQSDLQSALKILAEAGVEASLVLTQSSSDATEQARKAILDGCDTVFACGGDGTIHDVLQAMAGTRVALGIVPMGTANSLAHDLQLPKEPAEAVRAALHADERRIALGRVQVRAFDGEAVTRYFTVAVGSEWTRICSTSSMRPLSSVLAWAPTMRRRGTCGSRIAWSGLWFEWSGGESTAGLRNGVTEMLAVRIRNFGGILQELAPGASLERDDLRVVLCTTSSRLSYLLYVTRGLLRLNWKVPGVELVRGETVQCGYSVVPDGAESRSKVYVEADGELVGTLPAEITIVRDALTILMPKRVSR